MLTCPHDVSPPEDCVACDSRPHLVLKCSKCEAQTWHVRPAGEAWTCRRCWTKRGEFATGDLGLGV